MNFSNATILSYSRKSSFFGDVARYKVTTELSLKGWVLDLGNDKGVSAIVSQLDSIALSANNWVDITVNGVNFGQGIISDVKFSEGSDVTKKEYTLTAQIPSVGDFSSISTGDYNGLTYSNFQYLESFSEDSSFVRNLSKDTYTQNLKVVIKGPYSLNAVTMAQGVASNFFANNGILSTIGNQYNNSSIKRYYSESYDSINNSFDFSWSFDINRDSSGAYSVNRYHTLDFDAAGVAKITEKADYLGHTLTAFATVSTQAATDLAGAYARCSTIFGGYLNAGSNAALSTNPLVKSWIATPFEGKLNYSITFSNAAKIYTDSFWDYEISVDKTEGGVYMVSEQGSIVGFGHILTNKYQHALADWATISTGLLARLNSYYTGGLTLKLASDSTTFDQKSGKISYSKKYTDSSSLLAGTAIRKVSAKISKENNRKLNSSYNILNYKQIVQVQPNLLSNHSSYSVTLNGRADVSIGTYLSAALGYVTGPDANGFLSEANYSYNPFARAFTLNCVVTELP